MKKMFITERSIEEYRKILVREEKGRLTVEKYVRDMKKFYEYAAGKCISSWLLTISIILKTQVIIKYQVSIHFWHLLIIILKLWIVQI